MDLADLAFDLLIFDFQISSLSSNTLIGVSCLSSVLIPNCEQLLFPKAYISLFDVFTKVTFPPFEISIIFDNDGCFIGLSLLSVSPNPNSPCILRPNTYKPLLLSIQNE